MICIEWSIHCYGQEGLLNPSAFVVWQNTTLGIGCWSARTSRTCPETQPLQQIVLTRFLAWKQGLNELWTYLRNMQLKGLSKMSCDHPDVVFTPKSLKCSTHKRCNGQCAPYNVNCAAVPKESSQQPKHGQACDNFLVSSHISSPCFLLSSPRCFFLTSVKSAACKHYKGMTAYRVWLLSWMSHVRPGRESRRSRSRSRRRRR